MELYIGGSELVAPLGGRGHTTVYVTPDDVSGNVVRVIPCGAAIMDLVGRIEVAPEGMQALRGRPPFEFVIPAGALRVGPGGTAPMAISVDGVGVGVGCLSFEISTVGGSRSVFFLPVEVQSGATSRRELRVRAVVDRSGIELVLDALMGPALSSVMDSSAPESTSIDLVGQTASGRSIRTTVAAGVNVESADWSRLRESLLLATRLSASADARRSRTELRWELRLVQGDRSTNDLTGPWPDDAYHVWFRVDRAFADDHAVISPLLAEACSLFDTLLAQGRLFLGLTGYAGSGTPSEPLVLPSLSQCSVWLHGSVADRLSIDAAGEHVATGGIKVSDFDARTHDIVQRVRSQMP